MGVALVNHGRVRVSTTVRLRNSSLENRAGARLEFPDSGDIDGLVVGATLSLTNLGTIHKAGPGNSTLHAIATMVDSGNVSVQGGMLRLTALINYAANTLTAGGYHVSGGARLKVGSSPFEIRTNAASIILDGPDSLIVDNVDRNALRNLDTNAAGGILSLSGGANFTAPGAFQNAGVISLQGGSTFTASGNYTESGSHYGAGNLTVNGTLTWTAGRIGTNTSGGETRANGSLQINGAAPKELLQRTLTIGRGGIWSGGAIGHYHGVINNLSNAGGFLFEIRTDAGLTPLPGSGLLTFNNQGWLRKTQGDGTARLNARLTNSGPYGSVEVTSGTLQLAQLANYSARTLTGGRYHAAGTGQLQLDGEFDVVANAATISLQGLGARLLDGAGRDALANLASNSAAGVITLMDGAWVYDVPTFTNTGRVHVGPGSLFATRGNYRQTGGGTGIDNGELWTGLGGLVDIQAGYLAARGRIDGSVRNAGTLYVGGSSGFGYLEITGNYVQTAAGTLHMELGGYAAGTDADYLYVYGTMSLGGTLDIRLLNDLRYCIERAVDGDDIDFAVTGTINLTRGLPILTRGISLLGPGANRLTVSRDGPWQHEVFAVARDATVWISGLTITRGETSRGGGISNAGTLLVSDSTIADNRTTGDGGGVYNEGTMVISNTTLADNVSSRGYGGGVANQGTMVIISTTIANNGATWSGGGIANTGTLLVSNSTIANNRGGYFGGGGGIYNSGTTLVSHSTVAGNFTDRSGGGIFVSSGATLIAQSTIMANNEALDARDVYGPMLSLGNNLIGSSAGGTGYADSDLLNVNPLLGPLQNNGGPTFTMALLPGSPALDAGDPTDAPEFDQRGEGYARIAGKNIDIGAYEVQEESSPGTPLASGGGQRSRADAVDRLFVSVLEEMDKSRERGRHVD